MSILFFFMEKARRNGMGEQTKTKITPCLSENIAHMEKLFSVCDDIKKKQMNLGKNGDVPCYLTFIEVSVDMGTSALSEVLKYLRTIEKEEIYDVLSQNALGISDATFFSTIEEAADGLLTGETILFVDGFAQAVKIPDNGYPRMSLSEADSEVPTKDFRIRSSRTRP